MFTNKGIFFFQKELWYKRDFFNWQHNVNKRRDTWLILNNSMRVSDLCYVFFHMYSKQCAPTKYSMEKHKNTKKK